MFTINTFVEGRPLKLTSAITLSFFSWVFFISPNAFAINEELTKEDKRQARIEAIQDATPEQAYIRRLQKLKDYLTIVMLQQQEQAVSNKNNKHLAAPNNGYNNTACFYHQY